jgi:tRNA G10  N-methylase Trm11
MGFLMAVQTLVGLLQNLARGEQLTAQPAPGKVIYDPFVGTGSLLYACAHWGATVIGSDIDGRQIRGKGQ